MDLKCDFNQFVRDFNQFDSNKDGFVHLTQRGKSDIDDRENAKLIHYLSKQFGIPEEEDVALDILALGFAKVAKQFPDTKLNVHNLQSMGNIKDQYIKAVKELCVIFKKCTHAVKLVKEALKNIDQCGKDQKIDLKKYQTS